MNDNVLKFKREIAEAAARHGLDPALVAAIVETESAGETHAMRYEPLYRYLVPRAQRPATSSKPTEDTAQKTSWGLMQVMGGLARELGHAGWCTELCAPEIGLEFGCRYLAAQIARYGEAGGVSAYNQGRPRTDSAGRFKNQPYVDKVLRARETYRSTFAPNVAQPPSAVRVEATETPEKPLKKGKGK